MKVLSAIGIVPGTMTLLVEIGQFFPVTYQPNMKGGIFWLIMYSMYNITTWDVETLDLYVLIL